MSNIALLVGSTGFIGSHLGKELKNNGWKIISVSRNVQKSTTIAKFADEHLNINELSTEIISKCDGVFLFVGASIASKPLTKKYFKIVYDSRINPAKKIAQLIEQSPRKPRIVISASGTNYYGDTNEQMATENTNQGNTELARLCGDWERAISPVQNHTRLVLARIGMVLDANNGALPKMLIPFKLFIGGKIGNGNNWVPWIHRNDLIQSLLFTIENEIIKGPINYVAPIPTRMKELINHISHILKRPALLTVPESAIKLIMRKGSEILLNSIKAVPQKLIVTGYQFEFKNIYDALNSMLTK